MILHSFVFPAKRSASRDPYAAASRFGTEADTFYNKRKRRSGMIRSGVFMSL